MKKNIKTSSILMSLLLMSSVFTGCDFNLFKNDEYHQIYALAKDAGFTGTYEQWLESIKGEKGDTGNGIVSVKKTSTEGLVDTYTITFTDGTTTTFTITNGKDGIVSQPTGTFGLDYYPFEDGTLGVKVGKANNLSKIVIPSEYQGYKVTAILDKAFEGCSYLVNVEIPDTVTIIGERVFRECSLLASVKMSSSVTSIGQAAFFGCSSLASIEIPNSVTTIGNYAFNGCSSLTSIEIPSSVETIGQYAFSGCSSLQYNLYENGKYLGNKDNPYIVLIEVVNKNVKEFSICIDTKFICDSAFYGCSSLTSIEIPSGVTSIGECAFVYCDSLKSIVIPNSVTSIGQFAFFECTSLSKVYFKGTSTQWSNISKGKNSVPLTSASIYYYSETKPTTSGNYWHYDENNNPLIWENK